MITPDKKALMRKVINVFENDSQSPNTDYSSIYIYPDGPGDRRQLTLGFGITEYGTMKKLVQVYINDSGKFADDFRPFLSKLGASPLVDNKDFRSLLVKASKEDVIFRAAEDKIFEDKYFMPALKFFNDNGFKEALSLMVILDSYIHSGSIPSFLRSRFPASTPARGGSEREWITQYVNVRHTWLANHSRTILRGTIYRTNFHKRQIANNNWNLEPPLLVNGVKIPA